MVPYELRDSFVVPNFELSRLTFYSSNPQLQKAATSQQFALIYSILFCGQQKTIEMWIS